MCIVGLKKKRKKKKDPFRFLWQQPLVESEQEEAPRRGGMQGEGGGAAAGRGLGQVSHPGQLGLLHAAADGPGGQESDPGRTVLLLLDRWRQSRGLAVFHGGRASDLQPLGEQLRGELEELLGRGEERGKLGRVHLLPQPLQQTNTADG